jgi:hypothetical protein
MVWPSSWVATSAMAQLFQTVQASNPSLNISLPTTIW